MLRCLQSLTYSSSPPPPFLCSPSVSVGPLLLHFSTPPLFFQLSDRRKLLFSPTLINKFCLLQVFRPLRTPPQILKIQDRCEAEDWLGKEELGCCNSYYQSSSFHKDFVTCFFLFFPPPLLYHFLSLSQLHPSAPVPSVPLYSLPAPVCSSILQVLI